MKRILLSSALLFALAGCASVSDLPRDYTPGAANSEGLAVVSLTLSGKDLGSVASFEYRVRDAAAQFDADVRRRPYFDSAKQQARWLLDRDAQGPTAARMRVIVKDQASAEPLDVVEAGKAIGRLAAMRLPPGDYELYAWKVVEPNRYGGNEFTPKRVFSYPFKVEAGRATYLGNLDLRMSEQDTYKLSVDDKAARDLALLSKKLPALRAEQIVHGVGKVLP
ncbi:MAG TPA: hypothetical protein PKV97_07190 [Thauera aminoaromatica]|nr:hypothetical protein [Thauera aminoaromatica]